MTTQSGPPAARTGVIHDIGYRHYEGPRLGRAAIIRALAWYSLRSAFGIGRGAKAKIIPVIAVAIMCVPAVVNTVAVAGGRGQLVDYDTYVFQLRVLVMIIFIAAQAPELVSGTCAATCCRCTSRGRCTGSTTRWPSSARSSWPAWRCWTSRCCCCIWARSARCTAAGQSGTRPGR